MAKGRRKNVKKRAGMEGERMRRGSENDDRRKRKIDYTAEERTETH